MRNAMKITGAVLALGVLGSLTGCATMTPEQNAAVAEGITAGLGDAAIIAAATQPTYYVPPPRGYYAAPQYGMYCMLMNNGWYYCE